LFSAKPICDEFWPRTSPITIAGDRTARWARHLHAARQGPSLGKHAERSPPNLCLAGYTTFTALLHDKFLRPQLSLPALFALRSFDCHFCECCPFAEMVPVQDIAVVLKTVSRDARDLLGGAPSSASRVTVEPRRSCATTFESRPTPRGCPFGSSGSSSTVGTFGRFVEQRF
jgi:hypothetical protein